MKLPIVAMLCLLATNAWSQEGCFVTYQNPAQCYEGDTPCSGVYSADLASYGVVVAGLCYQGTQLSNSVTKCVSDKQVLTNGFNALDRARLNLLSRDAAKATLITKLKRACGTKCRNVR